MSIVLGFPRDGSRSRQKTGNRSGLKGVLALVGELDATAPDSRAFNGGLDVDGVRMKTSDPRTLCSCVVQ